MVSCLSALVHLTCVFLCAHEVASKRRALIITIMIAMVRAGLLRGCADSGTHQHIFILVCSLPESHLSPPTGPLNTRKPRARTLFICIHNAMRPDIAVLAAHGEKSDWGGQWLSIFVQFPPLGAHVSLLTQMQNSHHLLGVKNAPGIAIRGFPNILPWKCEKRNPWSMRFMVLGKNQNSFQVLLCVFLFN